MPIDTSIYQGLIQPRSVGDYQAEYDRQQLGQQQLQQNALGLQQSRQKLDEYGRTVREQDAARNMLGSLPSNATDEQRVNGLYGLGTQYGMTQAETLRKSMIERQKAQSEAQAKQAETVTKYLGITKDLATRVMAMPTPQSAMAALQQSRAYAQALGLGDIDTSQDEQIIASLQSPEEIKQWAAGHALQADKLLPTIKQQDNGGTNQTLAFDALTGKPTVTSTTAKTATPESLLSASTQRRGQDLTDARMRDANEQTRGKPFEVTGPDGPMLVKQDKQGNVTPVTGYLPKGGAGKPMTEGQAKANLFGSRAEAADKLLSDLAAKGTTRPGAIKGIAEATGNILGLGTESMGGALSDAAGKATNWTQSAGQQQVEQAQRDFINAVLRRESGAVIGAGEFRNAELQYFPQPNDSAEVKKQKADNRRLAVRGILAEVPKAGRDAMAPSGAPQRNITVDW
jgi:hypothetical protein